MKAELYTKSHCPYCIKALAILQKHNIEFENHEISNDPDLRKKASERAGGYGTVPMIFLDGKFIGGCSELQALEASGKLG